MEFTIRSIGTGLIRMLWITAMCLLLVASCLAKSNENPEATGTEADGDCISKTGLHCEIYGRGEPLLCLHGLGGSIYSWRELKKSPELQKYQLILIDMRGAGDSPKPHDKHYSTPEQADLIYEFILEKDLKNLTLIGNSYGGAVSLLVAIKLGEQAPERLSRLILIDSGGYNWKLPRHLRILRTPVLGWLALHLRSPEKNVRTILHDSYYDKTKVTQPQIAEYARPIGLLRGRYALLQMAKQVIPKNIDEIVCKYQNIRVPTLILWGERDKIIPLEVGERLHSAIRSSVLEIIPKAGHVPQEEQPGETIRHIVRFLDAHP
ncbi:MAG: alpha/beta hydrolase [Acidobacteriota bacterium]|nr:alpha/beta hydrolase [Acidobacteriota bacterium]